MRRRSLGVSVVLCFCLLSEVAARAGMQDGQMAVMIDLKQIVVAYHAYLNDNQDSAPKKASDLGPLLEKRAFARLESEAVVFIYGVRVKDMNEGASNTIIAYEKGVAESGGVVAYGDGVVKKLSADAFKKSIVAKAPER